MADPQSFRLPNDLEQVPALRGLFERSCSEAGVGDDEREKLKLVFTELVNNAIEHGCTRPSDTVEVWFRISEPEVEIEVSDPSGSLTQEDFTTSDATGFADTGRGAGLFLVQALSDEVTVRPGDRGGTTVRVVIRRGGGAGS